MKNRTLLQAAIAAGLFVSTAAIVWQDCPQRRRANRDAKVAGFKAPATWPTQLTQKWKQTVGLGNTTPALVGDRLFVLSRVDAEENVICLDATDGKEIWRQKYAAPSPARLGGTATPGRAVRLRCPMEKWSLSV